MSDPLSISAALLGIAATGFAIAKGLYRLADAIGSTGEEIRIYAYEIKGFSRLVDIIKIELLDASITSLYDTFIFEDIVVVCNGILEPFNRLRSLLTTIISRVRPSPFNFSKFRIKVQWIFAKKREVLFIVTRLKSSTEY